MFVSLYETFESIQSVLNTDRETQNLEIQYKYNTTTVYFLLYSIQVFFPKKIHQSPWIESWIIVDNFSINISWGTKGPKSLDKELKTLIMNEKLFFLLIFVDIGRPFLVLNSYFIFIGRFLIHKHIKLGIDRKVSN